MEPSAFPIAIRCLVISLFYQIWNGGAGIDASMKPVKSLGPGPRGLQGIEKKKKKKKNKK